VVNNTKTVLKTMLYTILSMIVILAIVVCFMYFLFTKTSADLMYNIGCNNVAANLYYKTYKKNNSTVYLYKALNLEIQLKDNENIIKYYEELVADEEWEYFLINIVDNRERLNIGILEKSSMLNEDCYLTKSYITALVNLSQEDKAWKIALEEFSSYNNFDLDNQGVYALSIFIKNRVQDFKEQQEGFDEILVSEMQEYFDNSLIIFENNKNTNDIVAKAYLIALGNRIINVGQDINTIYLTTDVNDSRAIQNSEKMQNINNVIKGIL